MEKKYTPTHSSPQSWVKVSGLLQVPSALPPLKELGRPQSLSGYFSKGKNIKINSGYTENPHYLC